MSLQSRSPQRRRIEQTRGLLAPLIVIFAIFSGLVAGCVSSTVTQNDERGSFNGDYPIVVVCTTGMVAELARNIGGEHLQVTALMGEGVDPHLYQPTPNDIARLSEADLILYSGHHLEGKMGEVFERMARRKLVVAVAEVIGSDQLIETSGQVDPHLWFDVALWSAAGEGLLAQLVQFDPVNEADYRTNAEGYLNELEDLNQEVHDQVQEIPEEKRVLVTAHDAFGYFGRAYGLEVLGIQGISTESEAGVREVNQLVDLIVGRKVSAVFVESSVSDRNIRALVEGCAAQGHTIQIGGELYSDAMGPAGTPNGTYIGMVRHNVETIVEALR